MVLFVIVIAYDKLRHSLSDRAVTHSNFHSPVQQDAALWSPVLKESRAATG